MQLDLMLCDHAQVSGDKLFVSGAGINRMRVPAGSVAPYHVTFTVAGTVTLSPIDALVGHTANFKVVTADGLTPTLAGPDGKSRVVGGELGLQAGDGVSGGDQVIAFSFGFAGVPLFGLGEHIVVVTVDGDEVRRLSFVVESA